MSGKHDDAAKKTGTELTKKLEKGELAKKQQAMPMGLEDVDIKNIRLPQLILLQGLSPAVIAGKGKVGEMMNNITDQIVAENGKSVNFIPSFYFKRRVKWIPMAEGGGIDCRSKDAILGDIYGACGDCPHGNNWARKQDAPGGKPTNVPPACTLYHCIMGHVEGDMTPMIIDMAKTKEKVANKLLSVMLFGGHKIPWAKKYQFSSVDETSKVGGFKYKNLDFKVLPGEPSKEDQEFAQQLFDMYRANVRNIDMDLQREDFNAEVAGNPEKDKDI